MKNTDIYRQRAKALTKQIQQGVLFAIPAHDRRIDVATIGGLIQVLSHGAPFVQPFFLSGNSDIRSARNKIANYFLDHRKECQHLFWADSDIGFNLDDFLYMMQGPEDLVVAPYSLKEVGAAPVDFGFGFVRMHRRVLEGLRNWTVEDGRAALNSYTDRGNLLTDFFVNGPLVGSRWFGEDTGFFHLCATLGIKPRIESRCKLVHIGPFLYGYPQQLPGFMPVEAGAQ